MTMPKGSEYRQQQAEELSKRVKEARRKDAEAAQVAEAEENDPRRGR